MPAKGRYTSEQVVAELKAGSGTQFDPRMVHAAVQWLQTNLGHILAPVKS